LALDDETSLCELTKEFLENSEYINVDTAGSVAEARMAIGKRRYDAIVSDYQMPGEDGIQFLKSLRSSGDTTPFILFTGKGREDVVIEALNNGADAYLQKGGELAPLYAELEHHIGAIVRRHRAEAALLDSESEFRTLFDDNPDGITLAGIDGKILDCNQAAARMMMVRKEEIIGGTVSENGVLWLGRHRSS
jgi:DNA-binding response OmpR family regulator